MIEQTIRQIIARRVHVEEISQGEDYSEIEKCWNQLTDTLCEDFDEAMRFLKEDCTEDEFSWISEVLDDVARREGSSKFIYCYKDLMPKFQEECEKYNIHEIVALAERILKEEKANGKG